MKPTKIQGKKIYANFRDARIVELLKVEVNEGDGKEDPMRRVAYLLTKGGEVVAKIGETENRLFAGGDEFIKLD